MNAQVYFLAAESLEMFTVVLLGFFFGHPKN